MNMTNSDARKRLAETAHTQTPGCGSTTDAKKRQREAEAARAATVERLIRDAKAEAWDEGYNDGAMGDALTNPYRDGAR